MKRSAKYWLVMALLWLGIIAGLWVIVSSCEEAEAETLYASGDTLQINFEVYDTLGVAITPDSLRLYVTRNGVMVDSSNTYTGTIAAQVGAMKGMTLTYVIPSTWSIPYDLNFWAVGVGDGLTDNAFVEPRRVRVNAALDTLGANAIADFYQGSSSATIALVDTCSAADLGIYSNDVGVSAKVYLVDANPWNSMGQVRAICDASNGMWRARVPLNGAYPDTLYVWAWNGVSYLRSGTQLIIAAQPTTCE